MGWWDDLFGPSEPTYDPRAPKPQPSLATPSYRPKPEDPYDSSWFPRELERIPAEDRLDPEAGQYPGRKYVAGSKAALGILPRDLAADQRWRREQEEGRRENDNAVGAALQGGGDDVGGGFGGADPAEGADFGPRHPRTDDPFAGLVPKIGASFRVDPAEMGAALDRRFEANATTRRAAIPNGYGPGTAAPTYVRPADPGEGSSGFERAAEGAYRGAIGGAETGWEALKRDPLFAGTEPWVLGGAVQGAINAYDTPARPTPAGQRALSPTEAAEMRKRSLAAVPPAVAPPAPVMAPSDPAWSGEPYPEQPAHHGSISATWDPSLTRGSGFGKVWNPNTVDTRIGPVTETRESTGPDFGAPIPGSNGAISSFDSPMIRERLAQQDLQNATVAGETARARDPFGAAAKDAQLSVEDVHAAARIRREAQERDRTIAMLDARLSDEHAKAMSEVQRYKDLDAQRFPNASPQERAVRDREIQDAAEQRFARRSQELRELYLPSGRTTFSEKVPTPGGV